MGLFQQKFAKRQFLYKWHSDFPEDRFGTMCQDRSFWDQNWGKAIIEYCCKRRQVSVFQCSYRHKKSNYVAERVPCNVKVIL